MIDESIRDNHLTPREHDYPLYLHSSLQSLRTAKFSNPNPMTFLEDEQCLGTCWL